MPSPSQRARLATVVLALTAAGAAVAGTIAGLGVPAAATAAGAPAGASIGKAVSIDPGFLTTSQLPQGSRYGSWNATRIFDGVPKRATFCLEDALPAADTRYVSYRAKKSVAAEQYVTVLAGDAAAAELYADVRSQIQGCFKEWLDLDIPQYADGKRKASWKRYGASQVEDGLSVYGVFTKPPKGFAKTVHMYAVGRDGAAVTVLHLAVLGKKKSAPVNTFTSAGGTAVRQMF